MDIPQIIELMHTRVNSLLNKIQKLLENQGYNFSLFRSFDDNKIRYNYMEYNSNISITKKLRLKKFIGCLSSIVNIVDENIKIGSNIRYKRISNFNVMDSIDAFISDLLIYNTGKEELITSITDNFGKTEEEGARIIC